MSEAREEILSRVRKSLGRTDAKDANRSVISQRLSEHARGPLPALNRDILEQFIEKAECASASLQRISSLSELGDAVSDYLEQHHLAQNIVAASSPQLAQISWPEHLHVEQRAALASDTTSLSVAYACIAETGTLALLSSKETPTTLNFLPEHFLCLLSTKRLRSYIEDVWDLIRAELIQTELTQAKHGTMPRSINYITGPSRTADVEQTIQLGAHGPRRLHIILLDE